MKTKIKHAINFRSRHILSMALAIGWGAPAFSQTTTAQAGQEPQRAAANPEGDIVVTATRRETTVKKIPFSIVAFSGDALRTQEIHTPDALAKQVPGVVLVSGDHSIGLVAIRGSVSTFRSASLDTPVGFFIDDVYYPYSTDLITSFFDVNRVEVLRGPQGTLFGRNVVGGAISIVTNNPTFGYDYSGQVSVGNGGYVRTEGMLNGALIDNRVAARIAFSTERSDGLIKTPNQPGNFGESDSYSVRGKLLFTPTGTLKIVASADYSYNHGNGQPITLLTGLAPGTPEPPIPASFGNFGHDRWTSYDRNTAPNSQRLRGGYLRADLDVFNGSLTSITGYRMNDSFVYQAMTNIDVPIPPIDLRSEIRNRTFTQEVRFASAPKRLNYVVGLFYLNGDFHTITSLNYNPLTGSPFRAGLGGVVGPVGIRRDMKAKVKSIAVFGEATFELTRQISIVAGGRYTSDRKDIDYLGTSPDGLSIPLIAFSQLGVPGRVPYVSSAQTGKTWNAFTPRVSLKYMPNETTNIYATFAKGFKSGGYNDASYRNPGLALEPESATNYEVGFKSRLFGNLLDLNLAIFRQKTTNLQNFSAAGGLPHTFNGTSLVKGLELESVVRPFAGLRLNFNYAYLDAINTELKDPATNVDSSGNPLKYVPKNSFTIGGNYTHRMANVGTFHVQAEFAYSDNVSTSDDNTIRNYPNLFHRTGDRTVNASIGFDSPDGRWSFSLWGKNITDYYRYNTDLTDLTAFFPSIPGVSYWRGQTNLPRTFGITIGLRK